jgi:hypothetical protein
VPLLIVAEQGREWGWASSGAFACYLIGIAGLAAFVLIERRMGDEALIPLRLFRVGPFSVGAAQSFVIGVGMFGGIACIPLYLQIVKGASPTKAGLLTLPLVFGLMVASMGAGQFTSRTGRYKMFPIAGSVLLVLSLVLLHTVGADTPLWRTDIYMALFGLGIGLNIQTIQLAMQNAVRPRDMGVATSSGIFFRQVGGTLGTAVFLSILFSAAPNRIATQYAEARQTPEFQAAAQAHPDQVQQLSGGHGSLNDTSFLSRMDGVLAHPFRAGFSQAMDLVFITGAFALLVAVVLSLCIREVPLRRVSGMEAARMEAEAAHATDIGGATH